MRWLVAEEDDGDEEVVVSFISKSAAGKIVALLIFLILK